MTNFQGKVILVSGATAGIGEAIAAAFHTAGATVYGLGRQADALAAARGRHPDIRWLQADVTKPAQVQGAVRAIQQESGRLDVLVNNAAVYQFAPLEASNEAMVRDQFEVNVFGLTFLTQAALAALKDSRGSIINISSAVGHKPSPGGSHYGATKAALESLTRSWALELAPHGVRVNAVAPGPTETSGFEKLPVSPEVRAAFKQQLIAKVPLGRMAASDEIARWVVHVADPAVTWMTGAVLAIDGGMSVS